MNNGGVASIQIQLLTAQISQSNLWIEILR